ncbi:LacI family DNA-binding transcriptional regulator [Paractinoplanes brasiliensis]|uniref:LacI family transcriptional regulator n=1 Tax=Paractinoplanes brasiliensis TaxID=52695 RepID=A0A4R6JJZ1_9ACTN|nr:LacI family DNA-binding transcriptional regulator [Actinoplanes brasiliensis]TDO36533.1 LacI family transcriptional regulator [Actinoplanes brasiliensis]GID32500.1 LacI family transcriptional regulator [Actinoplanes brasiliensis]
MAAGHRVTIYEVADRAQVSISTVSNVLNKPDRVSRATRERVLAAVDELGFVPKVQAVSLARQGTGRIGVMAPFTSYGSYLRRLSGLLTAATELEIDVLVFDHESAALASSPVLASMPVHGRLDGLVVMGLRIEDAIADRLRQRRLPTVAVDADSALFSRVVIDDRAGGRTAAEHLRDRGHRHVGYLLERQVSDYESQAIKRLAGFREVIAAAGGSVTVARSDNSVDNARRAAAELLDAADRPTAIMAHHDALAVGVLLAARDRGLRAPQDVAVMGFDDGDMAVAADLTTVRQPFEESGSTALSVLLGHLGGSELRSTTVLDVSLVQRSTT